MLGEPENLHVFPCQAGKTPACPRGFYDAVAGRGKIADLFRQYPGELVGAPTGAVNGFDVLDIDRGGGEDWLTTYEATHGLPPTRIVATRSGGLHIYFQHRVGMRCSAGLLAPGVDIRSTGGYVILWNLAGCAVLSEGPIPPWPVPMIQLLHEAEEARRRRYAAPNPLGGTLMTIAGTTPHEVPKALYLKVGKLMRGASGHHRRRVLGLLNIVVRKREGRNHALNTIGFAFRELISAGVITRDAVETLLIDAATLNGYVQKDGLCAAIKTINSALGPQAISVPPRLEEEKAE